MALPYWLLYEKPSATNWFSSDAACTMSTLGPPVPLLALLIAVPVADPLYLNVNCGYAALNAGWIRFAIRPESLRSLVPLTVSVEELSALASAGVRSNAAAASSPITGAPSSRRAKPCRRRGTGRV